MWCSCAHCQILGVRALLLPQPYPLEKGFAKLSGIHNSFVSFCHCFFWPFLAMLCRIFPTLQAIEGCCACFFHACPLDHLASWPSQDFSKLLGSASGIVASKEIIAIWIVKMKIVAGRPMFHTFPQTEPSLAFRSHEHTHGSQHLLQKQIITNPQPWHLGDACLKRY